eukprot:SAG31_NODE_23945_length_492_cov_1.178117_1_plen_145_part_10
MGGTERCFERSTSTAGGEAVIVNETVGFEMLPCRNMPSEHFLQCTCPADHRGAGPAILIVTLMCVLFTVLGVGGAATWTMTKFGVIGLTKEQADERQRKEEREDFELMMKERKKSKSLSFNKVYIQPFLTWKGTNTTRDPLRKAH